MKIVNFTDPIQEVTPMLEVDSVFQEIKDLTKEAEVIFEVVEEVSKGEDTGRLL